MFSGVVARLVAGLELQSLGSENRMWNAVIGVSTLILPNTQHYRRKMRGFTLTTAVGLWSGTCVPLVI